MEMMNLTGVGGDFKPSCGTVGQEMSWKRKRRRLLVLTPHPALSLLSLLYIFVSLLLLSMHPSFFSPSSPWNSPFCWKRTSHV